MRNVYNQFSTRISGTLSGQARQWLFSTTLLFSFLAIGVVGLWLTTSSAIAIPGLSILSRNVAGTRGQAGKLYILSNIPRLVEDKTRGVRAGRVTIVDLATQRELRSFDTGVDVDAIPAPDGSRLYIAAVDVPPDGGVGSDSLVAVDLRTGRQLWRVTLEDRFKGNGIPSVLAISPDGRWLYYYSYPWQRLDQYASNKVPYWITTVDTTTGRRLPETVQLPDCFTARLMVSPDGRTLYASCLGTGDIRFVNTQTYQVEQQLSIRGMRGKPEYSWQPGGIAGEALSPDGKKLYVITDDLRVLVIDTDQRRIVRTEDLNPQKALAVGDGLVSLVDDGKTLFIGVRPRSVSEGAASQVLTFNTQTWQEGRRITLGKSVSGNALAVRGDQRFLYAISAVSFPNVADTVVDISATGDQTGAFLTRTGEEILRIFTAP